MAVEPGAVDAPVEIRELHPDDICKRLSLGHKQYLNLGLFLERDAKRHHAENASKTYVGVNSKGRVVAYISLSCGLIDLGKPPDGLQGYIYKSYPAVRIGKLAVETPYREHGLGKRLVNLAIAIVTEKIMPNVGCRFLIVDSHTSAVEFYRKRGFVLLDTEENRASEHPMMFMDVGKLT